MDYDAWYDLNDDGIIDMTDIGLLCLKYGTTGTPINKTALLLELMEKVENLTARVSLLETTIIYLNSTIVYLNTTVPIGAIIPWAKSLTGVPSIPYGFVECNGQTLNDTRSPLHGQTIPNLNGEHRFLRGNNTSGSTDGSEMHNHTGTTGTAQNWDGRVVEWGTGMSTGHTHSFITDNAYHLPPYYSVVWIMRVK